MTMIIKDAKPVSVFVTFNSAEEKRFAEKQIKNKLINLLIEQGYLVETNTNNSKTYTLHVFK